MDFHRRGFPLIGRAEGLATSGCTTSEAAPAATGATGGPCCGGRGVLMEEIFSPERAIVVE